MSDKNTTSVRVSRILLKQIASIANEQRRTTRSVMDEALQNLINNYRNKAGTDSITVNIQE